MSFPPTRFFPDCTCSRHHRGTSPLAAAHRYGRRPYARLVPVLVALLGLWLLDAPSSLAQDLVPEPMHLAVTSAESAEVLVDLSSPMTHAFSSTAKWKGYLEFLGKPGTARSLGQPDLFLPVLQDSNDLTFLNIRGQLQFDNTDNSETNIGLGHRHMFEEWILGGYGYYDRRNTQYGSAYNQFTGGLELMSVDWAFRVNGYLPENQTNTFTGDADVSVLPAGDSINVQVNGVVQERALSGLDGEVGYLLPIPWEAYTKVFDETRVYAGGYHFLGQDQFESVTGPRGRLEMRAYDLPVLGPGSRFMMGVEAQWDEPRGSQAFGLASLRIPFDVFSDKSKRKRLQGLDRRMLQPVIRDVDVVTDEYDVPTETLPALNQAGQAYTKLVEVDHADEAAVNDAIANNTEGTILIVLKNNGGMIELSDTLALNRNQTLAGVDGTVGYDSRWLGSGSIGHGIAGAATGFLAGVGFPADNGLITMEPDSEVNGLTLDATGSDYGIRILAGDPTGTRSMTNSTVMNSVISGLSVEGSGHMFSLTDSEFIGNSTGGGVGDMNGGIAAVDGGRIEADRVAVTGGHFVGVNSFRDGSYIQITNSTVSDHDDNGLLAYRGGELYADHVEVRGTVLSAVVAQWPGSKLTINNSTVSGAQGAGLTAEKGGTLIANNVDVTNNSWGADVYSGVSGSDSSTLIITDSRIFDNDEEGVYAEHSRPAQAIPVLIAEGVIITGNGSDGARSVGGAEVTIRQSIISSNGRSGLVADDAGGNGLAGIITADQVTIANNGLYGALSAGGDIRITESMVSNHSFGNYKNLTAGSRYVDTIFDLDGCSTVANAGVLSVDGTSVAATSGSCP